jgi:putative transposase
MSRNRFIEAQHVHYPMCLLCQVLGVPTSGYYAWHQAHQQVVAQSTPAWETALVKVFCWSARTTDSTHGLRCAPNRLLNQLKPTQANLIWVSDITYLPLVNGDWAYLCAFQNVASKQVVGWQVGASMPEELVTAALQRALWAQLPTPGLLVHSDRGRQ